MQIKFNLCVGGFITGRAGTRKKENGHREAINRKRGLIVIMTLTILIFNPL